jgi:hypothetical protein
MLYAVRTHTLWPYDARMTGAAAWYMYVRNAECVGGTYKGLCDLELCVLC